MKVFITEAELFSLQNSYLYKNLPFAYIYLREMARKSRISPDFSPNEFCNFFARYDQTGFEIMFPDHSYLKFNFNERKIFVTSISRQLFKVFNFDNF